MSPPKQDDSPANDPRRPRDFGEVSRRISGRATDLIAIGIVLIAGLTMGARVAEWWRTDSTVPPPPPASALPWEGLQGVEMQFGDALLTIHRQQVFGSEQDAVDAMLSICRDVVTNVGVLSDPGANAESEKAVIARLEPFDPIEEVTGRWKLFWIGGPLPWIVGTVKSPVVPPPDAALDERLVCWAIALPQPDTSWTVYVIDRRFEGLQGGSLESAIPMPENTRLTMRVRGRSGTDELVGFAGPGPVRNWISELNDIFESVGWQRVRGWSDGEAVRAAAFARIESGEAVEITLMRDGSGWTGLIDRHRTEPSNQGSEAP